MKGRNQKSECGSKRVAGGCARRAASANCCWVLSIALLAVGCEMPGLGPAPAPVAGLEAAAEQSLRTYAAKLADACEAAAVRPPDNERTFWDQFHRGATSAFDDSFAALMREQFAPALRPQGQFDPAAAQRAARQLAAGFRKASRTSSAFAHGDGIAIPIRARAKAMPRES